MSEGAFDRAPLVEVDDRETWRSWLEANHATASGAWMVTWRRSSGRQPLDYEAAIEEALCFGWVDGRGDRLDELRSKLYFAPRRARSAWAKSNRERVERLFAAGRMAPAGIAAVERAKADGSWSILESVDRLEVPADFAAALDARPPARETWEAYPRSVKHGVLGWIALARRPETRAKRIEAAAATAERGERPNPRPGATGP